MTHEIDHDRRIALVVESGLVPDAETAELMVDLDAVRIDVLSGRDFLVNVNGRQVVVGTERPSLN